MKQQLSALALSTALLAGSAAAIAPEEAFPAVNTYPGFADVAGSAWYAATVQACYDALDDYFASLALLAATDFYDVLAHLIYPLRYMQAPVTLNRYQDAIRAILRTAVEKGRGMEVNTCRGRTLEEWRPILALYRDCGGELVTVGSDAHSPADVGKGVRAACALLRECGFRRVCTYEKHQPVFHTLG